MCYLWCNIKVKVHLVYVICNAHSTVFKHFLKNILIEENESQTAVKVLNAPY